MVTRATLAFGLALSTLSACDERPNLASAPTSDAVTADAQAPSAPDAAEPRGPEPFPVVPVGPSLDAPALLTRLSLDLRGIRPSPEERARVEGADSNTELAVLIEEFLADPRFGVRIADLWSQVLRTRVEDFPVQAVDFGLAPEQEPALYRAIGDEPLQIIRRIAMEDRPWTDVVTAGWTMTDDLLASVWPVEPEGQGPGWRPARYTDARPPAGVLSTNGLWWRYLSDGVSYGRGRANAIARIFLCSDFLDRPVDFPRDIDLTDEAAVRDAIRQNTGCIGCHSALDPLAGYLAGLQYTDKTATELTEYHPEREGAWRTTTELPPGFYGSPGFTLADLGRQLAADPRFVQCAVERTWELLLRRRVRETDRDELDALSRHREAFIAGGLTMRGLMRSILTDPRYREAPDPATGQGEKLVPPEVWANILQEWTGFRLTAGGADLLATDRTGFRTLAGGGDGRSGSEPATLPTTTMAIVWQRSAEAAAAYAVQNWEGSPLFEFDPATPFPEDAEDGLWRDQIGRWHERLFGTDVAPLSLEVDASLQLWRQLDAMDGPAAAWAGLLTALLRDPELVVY
ncbi:MAG: DUF1549 domain-containing protein [Myxococcales bacterium]|nr:DUF1549 domain-containing protein [Myxococcales bacterium]